MLVGHTRHTEGPETTPKRRLMVDHITAAGAETLEIAAAINEARREQASVLAVVTQRQTEYDRRMA